MKDIYLDNSATTKLDDEVMEYMSSFNKSFYANPSSIHRFGYLVEEEIKKHTKTFADLIGADPLELIWTSGGTESNNLAILGYAYAHKKEGTGIITTKIEHPSVLKACEKLSSDGYDVKYLDVDSTGHIDLKALEENITGNTILVSIMYVNNEIGSVQDIDAIGKLIKEKNKNTAFHVDFVQGFGKYKVTCKKNHIDFLSISSHKFNGPKGVGALYKKNEKRILPLSYGGGQQQGLRSGTLNTLGIVGMVEAAKKYYDGFDDINSRLLRIRDYLIDSLANLSNKYDNIYINTKKDSSFAPHIVSVSFKGIRSEVLVHALEEKGIYVSSGSACSSHSKKVSDTLVAIGLDKNLIDSTIRVSLGRYNDIGEIDTFITELDKLIPSLNIRKR